MRKQGFNKFGQHWWMEAWQDFEIIPCPNCLGPTGILFVVSQPVAEKLNIRETTGGQVQGASIKLEVKALSDFRSSMWAPCPWCGYDPGKKAEVKDGSG